MSIFKAYDVRGVVPGELDARTAYRVGRATARFLAGPRLVLGRDARPSSPALAEALQRGVLDEGVDVVDLGLVSTPMLYFAVDRERAAGGVMLTASHNPSHYNGFKICREHAVPVSGATGLVEIERLAARCGDEPPAPVRGRAAPLDLRDAYAAHAMAVGPVQCPPLRVAIDCGNGMGGVGLERVLARLPLRVERLYFEPDGRFPHHDADPLRTENLADVCAAVRRTGADLGVAFDGDGDRAVFVDERAEPVSSDLVTGLLAARILARHPGGRVLYDLRSSRATAEAIEAAGGVAERCRVGHSFIKATMRETGAVFAGELSGHFYFRFSPTLVADDGLAAFLAVIDLLASHGKPFSELVRPLARYFATGEINRRVEDVDGLLAAIEAEHRTAGALEISRLDGLLVRHRDFWFNLRPSNTEPLLRLNLEADTAERRDRERDRLLARIGGTDDGR